METTEFPPNPPNFALYIAVSGFVVLLTIPYLSKLTWEYFRIDAIAAKRWMIAFIAIVLTFLAGILIIGLVAGFFDLTPIGTLKIFIKSAIAGGTLAIGLKRKLPDYQDPDTYVRDDDVYRYQRLNRILTAVRNSGNLTVMSGILAGLALPLLAGMNHALTIDVEFEYLNIGMLLIVGYANLVMIAVVYVIFEVVFFAATIGVSYTTDRLSKFPR